MKTILRTIVFLGVVTLGAAILGSLALMASTAGIISTMASLRKDNSFEECTRVEAAVSQQRREIRDLFFAPIMCTSGVIAGLALAGLIVESRKRREIAGQPTAGADGKPSAQP